MLLVLLNVWASKMKRLPPPLVLGSHLQTWSNKSQTLCTVRFPLRLDYSYIHLVDINRNTFNLTWLHAGTNSHYWVGFVLVCCHHIMSVMTSLSSAVYRLPIYGSGRCKATWRTARWDMTRNTCCAVETQMRWRCMHVGVRKSESL